MTFCDKQECVFQVRKYTVFFHTMKRTLIFGEHETRFNFIEG